MTDALAQRVNGTLRKGILAAARSERIGALREQARHAPRRPALRGRRDVRRVPPRCSRGSTSTACTRTRRCSARTCSRRTEAAAVAAEYEQILDGIAERGLRVNVALKLTHLGLLLDEELAYAQRAAARRRMRPRAASFIRLDMEHSGLVDQTLGIYRRLRGEGRDAVGTVLQSYLYRTPADLEALLPLQPNLRLVKGAYLEPAEVAYPRKADVDAAYARLARGDVRRRRLRGDRDARRAPHRAGDRAAPSAWASAATASSSRCSTACARRSSSQLVARGFKVLVATPFGPQWYPYLMRRLGERPANILFVARNLVRR